MLLVPNLDRRFWAKVEMLPGGQCWKWLGQRDAGGYGRICLKRNGKWRMGAAHRTAYEMLIGDIPNGMHIDHLCRNRACVRPDHLEPVGQAENNRRGQSPMAIAARNGTCMRGLHVMSGDNVRAHRNGKRQCVACLLAWQAAYREKNREKTRKYLREWKRARRGIR